MMVRILAHFLLLLPYLLEEVWAECVCEDPTAMWCDEFSGSSLNEEHWMYDLGGGGWGNFESQVYTQNNALIQDEKLHIQATREDGGQYSSSRILTKDKVAFQYVRLEASIKVSNLEGGLWPAFWLLGSNFDTIGWPYCGEIDIMELGSAEAIEAQELHQLVLAAMHWNGTANGTHVYEANRTTVPGTVQEFHVYSLDWTPQTISMYVDDKLFFSKAISGLPQFRRPFFILLNVAVGGLFTGILEPNTTTTGGEMVVEWLRAYDNGSGSIVTIKDQSVNYSRGDCDPPSSAATTKQNSWATVGAVTTILGRFVWVFFSSF
jgi:beta-glucanase (GH16 family)